MRLRYDLTDEEKERLNNELKKLEKLSVSSGVEAIDPNLTKEEEEWLNRKLPNDSFKDLDSEGGVYSTLENLTYEEWYSKLVEKYQRLYDVIKEKLPNLWDSLEFELSVQKILNIKKCNLPFAGIVLGKPSSLKTVGIEMFRKWKNSFYTDNFSAKAFVSHSTSVKKQELEQIDLLPKIRNKVLLTPELSPTFTKKDDDLIEILGILIRVLDGQGYESDSGAHGHRGYHGEYMFVWIGAAVDIPYKVYRHLGNLGAKLYFLRLPGIEKSEDEYLEDINNDDFISKTKAIQERLIEYLNWFEDCPFPKENNIAKVEWDFKKDDKESKRFIVKLGRLLAHLRGTVTTFETKDPESQGKDYGYAFANIEDPSRAIRQLTNLARGHALSQGRNYIAIEDVPLIIKVVLSTASTERTRIFETLLNFGGQLTTSQIVDYLNISANTAKRTMAEFKALDLVDLEAIQGDHGGEPQKLMILHDDFRWFLSEQFKCLRFSHRKDFSPHNIIQNYIAKELYGGNFSYSGIPNITYQQQIILNSVIPRSSIK